MSTGHRSKTMFVFSARDSVQLASLQDSKPNLIIRHSLCSSRSLRLTAHAPTCIRNFINYSRWLNKTRSRPGAYRCLPKEYIHLL